MSKLIGHGLLELLAMTLVFMAVGGSAALIYTMRHPQRRTLAYALAKQLPSDPSQLDSKLRKQHLSSMMDRPHRVGH